MSISLARPNHIINPPFTKWTPHQLRVVSICKCIDVLRWEPEDSLIEKQRTTDKLSLQLLLLCDRYSSYYLVYWGMHYMYSERSFEQAVRVLSLLSLMAWLLPVYTVYYFQRWNSNALHI